MSHTTTSFPLLPFGQCSMPKGAGITTHFSTLSVEGEFASTPEGKNFYKRKIEMNVPMNVPWSFKKRSAKQRSGSHSPQKQSVPST